MFYLFYEFFTNENASLLSLFFGIPLLLKVQILIPFYERLVQGSTIFPLCNNLLWLMSLFNPHNWEYLQPASQQTSAIYD